MPAPGFGEECHGDLIYGEGDREELQHAVVHALNERRCTLGPAEMGPGGAIADWLSEASHDLRQQLVDSRPYRGGRVVPPGMLATHMGVRGRRQDETELLCALTQGTRERLAPNGKWACRR